MCAHYESLKQGDRLARFFGLRHAPADTVPDVWPGYRSLFLRRKEASGQHSGLPSDSPSEPSADHLGPREAAAGLFGLLPHWAKDARLARHTYNARSETVADKPSFRDAWRKGQRCVVPAEAIFEPDWRSGRAVSARIVKRDGSPMGLAGLWARWYGAGGEVLESFTLLTVNADAHPFMRHYHRPGEEKRMVVILQPWDYDAWLAPGKAPDLLRAFPAGELVSDPVSREPSRVGRA